MDFIYRNKKKIRNILLTLLTLAVFSGVYYVCVHKLENSNTQNTTEKSVNAQSELEPKVSSNANVIFKIKYTKSGDIIKQKENNSKNLSGKTKGELNDMYKEDGYKVTNMTNSQVVFTKEVDKYAPNKYALGIKNGYIAIYRTDSNGNMFIEDKNRDITDIKISRLKKADIELLTKGNKYFECDTREDAEARLEDYE
ncbi:hypothetical protein D4Z93_04635 [Clostridium fermenticellae]|uniref:Bypass of forespore C C-terminal domain-containing protein n=1 Tax=Clostridium fermenticellae TaxID=2068654 RepID=A0A386H2C1_9CLOT|nr:hypothetical protein [Clostridium fermenticellae]AYD39839.1 hypothetical protein D4Z93_04635 [Clostridium fermenticellae]